MAVTKEESSSKNHRPFSGSYYLAKCVLKGSVVLQVVQGHIRSSTSTDIVFGKETSIELVIVGEDGTIESVCEQSVFGTIKDLAILHWNETFKGAGFLVLRTDVLAVLSDSGKISFLSFSNEIQRFFAVRHIQLSSPGNLRHQLGRNLVVDSNSCFIAVSAHESQLALLPLSSSADNENTFYDIGGVWRTSIPGTIWSMCFVSRDSNTTGNEQNHTLAVLVNKKGASLNELLVMEWCVEEYSVRVVSQFVEAGPLAHDVIEVPRSRGFLLLFRLGDILVLDIRDASSPNCVYRKRLEFLYQKIDGQSLELRSGGAHEDDDIGIFKVAARALLELGDNISDEDLKCDDDPLCIGRRFEDSKTCKYVCSWCWAPESCESPKMIFCTSNGEFCTLDFHFNSGSVEVNISDPIYRGLPSKELLWVDGGFLISLMDMGDGMVLMFDKQQLLLKSFIQNIAPITDISFMDCHKVKKNQMYACCGMAPEGSLRIIPSGVGVEKLVSTAPVYEGITNIFALRMKIADPFHSFFIITFVEQTRVLSVGLRFSDITDSVGFQSDVCSLACGVVDDGILAQIHRSAVRLCLPTVFAHADGVSSSYPICTTWFPDNHGISLGAVGYKVVVVSTSNPTLLLILGIRSFSEHGPELYVKQHLQLQSELSCIFVPSKPSYKRSYLNFLDTEEARSFPSGVSTDSAIVIGTHKPSVEVVSFVHGGGVKVIAVGPISSTSSVGTSASGCVPQDVRVVLFDKFYILSGLRNGMVLKFEWPSYHALGFSPAFLKLIAARRVGVTPVFLEPLEDSLDSDIVVLSDRPWLLQTARIGLSYSSISFQKSTHVAAISSVDCPSGILFVAENCLHLVDLIQSKRLNVQKFDLMGTPRKILYHTESGLLLVMRTDLEGSYSSDICCVDPFNGTVISTFKFLHGESGKSMEILKVGNCQVILVGTGPISGPAVMSTGEAERSKGRIIVLSLDNIDNSDRSSVTSSKVYSSGERTSHSCDFSGYVADDLFSSSHFIIPDDTCIGIKSEEATMWQLQLRYSCPWPGMVLALSPYLDRYFLASAGDSFFVCGFHNDRPQRVRKLAVARTRFMITSLTSYMTRIAVGDCRDGVLFYSYNEDTRKLEQLCGDPQQRLVADCVLIDEYTAIVSDRKCTITALSSSNYVTDDPSPESNLAQNCSYYLGEISMRMKKGCFSHNLPTDGHGTIFDSLPNSITVATLLGSVVIFTPVSREEHEVLERVEKLLSIHPITAPVLGNDHEEFRSRECKGSKGGGRRMLDGDMLSQFLELTIKQQDEVLSFPLNPHHHHSPTLSPSFVSELLERIHHALA